jgi:hypothetical membrane protein
MKAQSQPKISSYNHSVRRLFFLLFYVMLATFGISILLYGEEFLFWKHALSDLGCTMTRMGRPNRISRWVFALGMMVESFIMLRIWEEYTEVPRFRNQAVKAWLAHMAAMGYLFSILPNDKFHTLHSAGVGVVVGALYFFSMIYHYELKEHVPAWRFSLDVVLLQIAVFPHAISFFADWNTKQSFQKICIMGLFYILLKSVLMANEDGKTSSLASEFGKREGS